MPSRPGFSRLHLASSARQARRGKHQIHPVPKVLAQAVFAAVLSFGAATPSFAIQFPTTFSVTTAADSGPGSLRQALQNASQTFNSTIVVDPSVTSISLQTALPSTNSAFTVVTSAPLSIDLQAINGQGPLTLRGSGNVALNAIVSGLATSGSNALTINPLVNPLAVALGSTSAVIGGGGATGAAGIPASPALSGVDGGPGTSGSQGVRGGAGVAGSGFSLDNAGSVAGGVGGVGGAAGAGGIGGAGILGATGYDGMNADEYCNMVCLIPGGTGGAGAAGSNGRKGGDGASGAAGAAGGAGLTGSNFILNNSGSITGGTGGAGGVGGTGGTGGTGGKGGTGGHGGDGGFGWIEDGPGGAGGRGGNGGTGGAGGVGGNGGAGGIGGAAVSGDNFVLRNTGTITGGNGGMGSAAGAGGAGGAGGNGGSGGTPGSGSVIGALGAVGTAGNTGAAGLAGAVGTGGQGGVGVNATGNSTISNAGTIAGGLANGGAGARADAVQFSNGANKLVLESGSILIGNAVSLGELLNGGDTLALGGDVNAGGGNTFDLATIGNTAQYRGFQKFSKEGSSEWTLQGAGSSSWSVESGTLGLADAAALTGSIDVKANGTLRGGNGTMTGDLTNVGLITIPAGKTFVVNGNFSTSGTFKTGVADAAAGRLQANGAVTLGGSLVVDTAGVTSANTHNGTVANVITGTTVAGTFGSTSDNSLLFNFKPVYTATSVNLQLELAPVIVLPTLTPPPVLTPAPAPTPGEAAPVALEVPPPAPVLVVPPPIPAPTGGITAAAVANSNSPAFAAARVLDAALFANPGSNLALLFVPLATQQQVSQAVTQTLPSLAASSANVTRSTMSNVSQIVQSRLDSARGMSSGDEFITDKRAWVKAFGSWANQADRDGVSGFKSSTYGLVTGVDADVSKTLRVGGAFAYSRSDIDSRSVVAPQGSTVDAYQVIGYGAVDLGARTELSWQADLGHNANKGHRQISFANLRAKSDFSSSTAHVGVALGRDLPLSDLTTFTPSVRADYTWIRDRSYTETGADALNLAVEGRTTKSFIIGVDGKLQQRVGDRGAIVGNAGVGYDTMDQKNTIVSSFAGAPGAAFTLSGIEAGRVVSRAGLGYVYQLTNGVELTARYDAEHRTGLNNQTASVKARWAF